jgi:hypothetical protein
MAFSFTYPYPMPSSKGWGPGWPNCQSGKIVPHPVFQGGVHKDIKVLTDLLVQELERRGYSFKDGWSWGYACRGTKTSSGSQTDTPSVHSWGLALDFNAPLNPFGAATNQNMPAWVVKLMREYGFFWLGPSIQDWMHFHFAGSPADARRKTAKAKLAFSPNLAYRVAGKTYGSVEKAMEKVRDTLKSAKLGAEARVKVVRKDG